MNVMLPSGDPPIYRFWKDTHQSADSPGPNSGTAGMVETTAYALLTCLNLKETYYVNPIIKWLSEEQRYGGGFYSTQVMCVSFICACFPPHSFHTRSGLLDILEVICPGDFIIQKRT